MGSQLWAIEGNAQRLDGGAMFGNAPRVLWERWHAPDERNRIQLATRAVLICESSGRLVLLEAGIGAFFPPKLRDRFGVLDAEHVLLRHLSAIGVTPADIDLIVLSHLHFDHAGGLLAPWEEGAPPRIVFPKATFLVGSAAWERARAPHVRDRASFIPELPALLEQSGRLALVSGPQSPILGPAYRFHYSDGHTPGMMLTEFARADGAPLVFVADLAPGRAWLHAPITMGYDRFPEQLTDEKEALFADLATRGGSVFFTHDPSIATAEIVRDETGRFTAGRCSTGF